MRREPWHASLLESLALLGSIKLQRRHWIGPWFPRDRESTHYFPESPGVLLDEVFEHSALDHLLSTGEVFSRATDALLRKMNDLAGHVDFSQPYESLLHDPTWLKLAELANAARREIDSLLEE